MRIIKTSLYYVTLLTLTIILSLSLTSPAETRAETGITCVATNEQVDGQGFNVSSLGFNVSSLGFNVSSLGFNVSSLGFNVSSLGFNVSSLGFNVSSLEDIINQLLTEVKGEWFITEDPNDVDPIDTVITGPNYNAVPVVILVVDDFTNPPGPEGIIADTSHGFKVAYTIQWLLDEIAAQKGASAVQNISIQQVNIGMVNYDAALVAGQIESAVDALGDNVHVVINMSFGLVPCDDDTDVTLVDDEAEEYSEFTVTEDFSFNDYSSIVSSEIPVERPYQKISPVLECVIIGEDGKSKIGYFGYYNPNPYTVTIPIGAQNKIAPRPKDRGQPTQFAPGRHRYVFSVERDRGNIVWKLGNKTSTAGKKSPKCNPEQIPENPPSRIYPEGYGLSNYFNEVMGIPPEFVDEYFQYLFSQVDEAGDDDPFVNIQALMKSLLIKSYNHATDGDPNTNFAAIPVASSGNFRHLLGGTPLKPADYPEVVAIAATVGDDPSNAPPWPFSHDGNFEAPGVSIFLATDAEGAVTELGAGTSYAAPHASVLGALWLTYENACIFNADGTPPLNSAVAGISNLENPIPRFSSSFMPYNCAFDTNEPPEFNFPSTDVMIDEFDSKTNIVTDADGDTVVVTISENAAGLNVIQNEETGEWSLVAGNGDASATVTLTATDENEAVTTITLNVTVLNIAPTADFSASPTTVNTGEIVTLTLSNPFDPGVTDVLTYGFTCGNEVDALIGESLVSATCVYNNAGTYIASGTIGDGEDENIYDVEIIVNSTESIACYATEVIAFNQGTRKNGKPVRDNRSNPNEALYAPQNNDTYNFVALGFDHGEIILGFGDSVILNENGTAPDFKVWETSFNDANRDWKRYPEKAEIYARDTATGDWVMLTPQTGKDIEYDLEGLPFTDAIKIVNTTDPSKFGGNADGFDVDGVEGFDCGSASSYIPTF